jgi:hypothetical protein
VPVAEVRAAIRRQFRRWGRPAALRVDNGVPWGNRNDLPTPFILWLIGLGVELYWNDPCRPQQNPKIERSQGTGKRWSEPGRCGGVAELQANLDEADRIQREEYPTAAGASRLELFAGLRHSGRAYTRAGERSAWSIRAVRAHLAEYVAVRKVSAAGEVALFDPGRYVGKQYHGQYLQVQYDPRRRQWLFSDAAGRELRRCPAPEITAEQIFQLTFHKKRKEA